MKIESQDLVIRHGQAKYKLKNHGADFDIPSTPNKKGNLITKRTPENIKAFKEGIVELIKKGEQIEGTPDEYPAIHFIDRESKLWTVFKKETGEFISGWVLGELQYNDLMKNGNVT